MFKLYDLSNNVQIVRALKEGDSKAFEFVYESYSPYLKNYANSLLQDVDAAYEVVQDVFVAVWMHRSSLDETKSFRNYLLRSVHNNSLKLLQTEKARKAREEQAIREQIEGWKEDSIATARLGVLMPAIEQLPERSRKVLQMSCLEEKKNAIIADELSISIRTVETILYKVKKKLRKIVGGK